MLYYLVLSMKAWHTRTSTWHTHKTVQGVRARSRNHALDKGLRVIVNWPGYKDRANDPDWHAEAEAQIIEEGL